MLLRALLLLAFLAALSASIVAAAGALARSGLARMEGQALRSALVRGVQRAQTAAVDGAVPAPLATCAITNGAACAMQARITITPATPGTAPTPTACPQTDCSIYLQENSRVAEGRASYQIAASILATNGDVLASRAATVTFRTFASPPYATLAGSTDATLDAVLDGGNGDDGGAVSTNGTAVDVQYQLTGSGARTPGNVWQRSDEHAAVTSPAWQP